MSTFIILFINIKHTSKWWEHWRSEETKKSESRANMSSVSPFFLSILVTSEEGHGQGFSYTFLVIKVFISWETGFDKVLILEYALKTVFVRIATVSTQCLPGFCFQYFFLIRVIEFLRLNHTEPEIFFFIWGQAVFFFLIKLRNFILNLR